MEQLLPLSWRALENSTSENILAIDLGKDRNYLAFGDLPFPCSNHFHNFLLNKYPKGYLVRGVSESIKRQVKTSKAWTLPFGLSASIALKNFSPTRSTRELIRAGGRQLTVSCVSKQAAEINMNSVWKYSSYAQKEPLRYLFRTDSSKLGHVYAAKSRITGEPVAIASFSKMYPGYFHLEQFVRSKLAPRGSMELLLSFAFTELQEKHEAQTINLGEVPFTSSCKVLGWGYSKYCESVKSRYSVRGLYNFKNKFSPHWQPSYILGSWSVSPKNLLNFVSYTRSLQLLHPKLSRSLGLLNGDFRH